MPLTGAVDLLPSETDVEGIGGVTATRQSDTKLGGWHRGQLPGRLAEVGVFRGSDLPWNERGSAKTTGWPSPASQHRRAAWPGPGLLGAATASLLLLEHLQSFTSATWVPRGARPPTPPSTPPTPFSTWSAPPILPRVSGEAPHLGSSHVPLPTSVRSQAVAETPGCLPNI